MASEPFDITAARLLAEQALARADKATPGPWESPLHDLGTVEFSERTEFYFSHAYEAYPPLGESGPVFVAHDSDTTAFIAHSRLDVPNLAAAVLTLCAAQELALQENSALKRHVAEGLLKTLDDAGVWKRVE